MADDTHRSVDLERVGTHLFRATNSRGTTMTFGSGDGVEFTPIELLLVAIGGCTALDVEYIVGKRSEPESLSITVSGEKIRDDHGNRMSDLTVEMRATFPAGQAGDAARAVLPDALRKSHDRLCTVSRTVEVGTPVTSRLAES
jgi:uncharacterized OsmC-like protein